MFSFIILFCYTLVTFIGAVFLAGALRHPIKLYKTDKFVFILSVLGNIIFLFISFYLVYVFLTGFYLSFFIESLGYVISFIAWIVTLFSPKNILYRVFLSIFDWIKRGNEL